MTESSTAASLVAPPLLGWYDEHARDLPWRGARDPYRIWVSEIMLQQTQVETVRSYYGRFLERFPTVEALAAASEDAVLAAWSGLGFYRRARNLHRAARVVVDEHGGELPRDPKRLRALPGLGRYTVGAILSIAHDDRLPILDGNVTRVLARLFEVEGSPSTGPVSKRLWALAEAVLPPSRAGDFNQALMELGALVCRPRSPHCGECPLTALCGARDDPEAFPHPNRKQSVTAVERVAVYLVRPDGRFRIVQRPAEGLLASMWELPAADVTNGVSPAAVAARILQGLGARSKPARRGTSEHRFSHRHWKTHVFEAATRARAATEQGTWVWEADLAGLGGVPTVTRKMLQVVRG